LDPPVHIMEAAVRETLRRANHAENEDLL
jgi:hypothetical protein